MTIVVTGSTGFLGRQVIERFINQGQKLRLIVRNTSGLGEYLTHPLIQTIICNNIFVATKSEIKEMLEGASDLVHLAWYVNHEDYISSPMNIECMIGTIRIAQSFLDVGGKRFTGIGTCLEYSNDGFDLYTSTPSTPQSLYAACKASTFNVISNLFNNSDGCFTWCRVYYLYGEGEDSRRLAPSIKNSMEIGKQFKIMDGSKIVDFLDVKDAASQISEVVLAKKNGAINICSGIPITIREFAENIANEYGRSDLLQFENSLNNACK